MGLPDGPTGAIDGTDPEWWNSRTYLLTEGERWMYLYCSDTFEPPEDRWLSIAETFEFLELAPASPSRPAGQAGQARGIGIGVGI